MKKIFYGIASLILTVTILVGLVLSVNIDLNIKIRKQIYRWLQDYEIVQVTPSIYWVDNGGIAEIEHSKQLMSRYLETGLTYVNIDWILDSATTYHIDETIKKIEIIRNNDLIEINAGGNIAVNGVAQEDKVEWISVDGLNYLAYEPLTKIDVLDRFGIAQQSITENGNIIFVNEKTPMDTFQVTEETLVFSTEESIRDYYKSVQNDSFYYGIKNLFNKPEVLGDAQGQTVWVQNIENDLYKVVGSDNSVGYVSIETPQAVVTRPVNYFHENRNLSLEEPVYLTWEAVYSYNPDPEKIPNMSGLNVISPTWYELVDSSGNVSEKVSQTYLQWAEEQGYQVWALVSNAFDIDRTHAFLHDSKARRKFIDYMIDEAVTNGYHGINIDFENVYMADRDALTHFVNAFKVAAYANNLILSMDVTVMGGSDNWSKCYDHQKLGHIVDYLIVMTYDEFWQSSPISGPVASFDWVNKHMIQLASVVQSEKLVLGLPTYTRVWREKPSNSKANAMTTSATAIGMSAQNALIEKYDLELIWDDTDRLYYATFFEEDAHVKMWVETAETLSIRADLVNQLNLGGIALWRRGFETQDVWDALNQVIN